MIVSLLFDSCFKNYIWSNNFLIKISSSLYFDLFSPCKYDSQNIILKRSFLHANFQFQWLFVSFDVCLGFVMWCYLSQHFHVRSTLWVNVEITLIRRWKWNKIRRRIFNVEQSLYNVSARRWSNVETTLHSIDTLYQRCFNVVSTLAKAISNPFRLLMIVDL